MNKKLDEILKANDRQKEFYNSTQQAKKSLPTKIWFGVRNKLLDSFRGDFQIKNRVYEEHKNWLGDISEKKILDLGCLRGNALSIYMAKNAGKYIGIDLSDTAIKDLKIKLKKKEAINAEAIAVDFLSPDFREKNFDIIYAYGVLHHFEDFDILLARLKEKLAPKGAVISYDPLETSTPIKLLRKIYRPFQSDKDWEWPFTKETLQKIERNFKIAEIRGILGKSKYGLLLNLLPLNAAYKDRTIKKLIEDDWYANDLENVYDCMHITMLFHKSRS